MPDVIIVGGGPAGAWTAYCLARAGARVTVFDHSHPREKPCGGGITVRALTLIEAATSGRVPSFPFVDIRSARFEADSTSIASHISLSPRAHPSKSTLIVCSRREFDAALLSLAQEAGATWIGERVDDVEPDSSRGARTVRTARRTLSADIVVGADGANSLVRRRLDRAFTRAQLSIATGYYAADSTSNEVVIRCTSEPSGYLWSFPRPDHLAVGVCAAASESQAGPLRSYVREWLEHAGLASRLELRQYGWPIPTLSNRDLAIERPAGDRWLLVGDAAGLVDSITREGIYYALRSAELAAQAILHRVELAPTYLALLDLEIYPELRRAAALKDRFFRPAFIALLLEALDQSPAIRLVMADLIAGSQPYRGLRRRLLSTFEFGLASRLLLGQITRRLSFYPRHNRPVHEPSHQVDSP